MPFAYRSSNPGSQSQKTPYAPRFRDGTLGSSYTLALRCSMELAAASFSMSPTELRDFFKRREAGTVRRVKCVRANQRITGQLASSISMPGYTNVLNVPVHETRGAYEFCDWEPGLLERYANGILGSIPSGSVYFGGTDPGRFVITMFHDTTKIS